MNRRVAIVLWILGACSLASAAAVLAGSLLNPFFFDVPALVLLPIVGVAISARHPRLAG